MHRHDELEADLAQYYNIDLERMGDDFSTAHAACLAAQLPKGSRCNKAENPKNEWGDVMWTLWRMERNLNLLRWGFVKYDGEPQPGPMPYPGQRDDEKARAVRYRENKAIVDAAFGMNGGEND